MNLDPWPLNPKRCSQERVLLLLTSSADALRRLQAGGAMATGHSGGGAIGGTCHCTCHWGYRTRADEHLIFYTSMAASARRLVERLLPPALALMLAARMPSRCVCGVGCVHVGGKGVYGVCLSLSLL